MKKELRARISNQSKENKHQQQTKPSISKHLSKTTKEPPQLKEIQPDPPIQPPTSQIFKSDIQSYQPAFNAPSNIHLDHYMSDIHNHISSLDKSFNTSINQQLKNAGNIEITSDMRKILVKWLMKIAENYRIHSQTMHFCVQLIDYILIYKGEILNKTNFQLLGITCLFISCKYNEIYAIQSQRYVQFCKGIYTIQQLMEMQSFVLFEINFNLQLPTVHQFISKFAHELTITTQHLKFIRTIADISIFDFNTFNNFSKFQLATAITYFTAKLYKLDALKLSLVPYKIIFNPETFKECFMAVVVLFKKNHLHPNLIISN